MKRKEEEHKGEKREGKGDGMRWQMSGDIEREKRGSKKKWTGKGTHPFNGPFRDYPGEPVPER